MQDQRKPPRQARGQRRVDRILEAAAALFAERGVEGASMGEIARAAGASPGSLYQFFPNKAAVAEALAARFAAKLEAIVTAALPPIEPAPMESVLGPVIRDLADFYAANPAYVEVYHALNRPAAETTVEQRLDAVILDALEETLESRAPRLDPGRRHACAATMLGAAHAQLSLISVRPREERAALERELLHMLTAYLMSLRQGGEGSSSS